MPKRKVAYKPGVSPDPSINFKLAESRVHFPCSATEKARAYDLLLEATQNEVQRVVDDRLLLQFLADVRARLVIEKALGRRLPLDYFMVPQVVYFSPVELRQMGYESLAQYRKVQRV